MKAACIENPYSQYLQKQWPFKLVTSQIFGLYVIGLYALPLVSAALRAFYGNTKQWFTQFSEDSILFDIWLSVYCAALLILAFTVYAALRFNHSSQWIEEQGKNIIKQNITHRFHGYLNADIKDGHYAESIRQLKSEIGELDGDRSKITYIKYAFGDWWGLDVEEPIYAALHLTHSGERNRFNDLTRNTVDLDKRVFEVAVYLELKWRFLYNSGLGNSSGFIELLAQQRREDEELLDKISALWPGWYANYFNGTRVGVSELMNHWPEDNGEPKLDVVRAMIEQCYGNLVCRTEDEEGSEAWLSEMLQGHIGEEASTDKSSQRDVQKNTEDYLFKLAVAFLVQTLGDSKTQERWDNQRQEERWLRNVCLDSVFNQSKSQAVLDELWSFISAPNLTAISEWSLKSVYDILPFEKRVSHLIWLGAYDYSDDRLKLVAAQHYELYEGGLQKDSPLINGEVCELQGGRTINKDALKAAVWDDLDSASYPIDSWCSQEKIDEVIDTLFDSSISMDLFGDDRNEQFDPLYLLMLKCCMCSEWEVCKELNTIIDMGESVCVDVKMQKEIELYKERYPQAMPRVIEKLESLEK
ncbi:hypothetical protein OZX62_01030 [Bifidobacterium sp. ESL0690]|uniref:hypothetical protein n=1 Tax=Bifidobacterium sp. ESL0690 TaxID=2983214 RepID=UPI0023F903AD|nr:hypothetical protein [Bifidobacterium sp. ESL0690]WEV46913.1 hypothetical protein OZX62_01030 [Bifidobacterium sp. ESL0690]